MQSGVSGDVSAEEMQAAMRSVEDETDAAAAAALEQENAAELAEFTLEPASQVNKCVDRVWSSLCILLLLL